MSNFRTDFRVSDALVLADKSIKFKGDEDEKTIFGTIHDMSAFQLLDDCVSMLGYTFSLYARFGCTNLIRFKSRELVNQKENRKTLKLKVYFVLIFRP